MRGLRPLEKRAWVSFPLLFLPFLLLMIILRLHYAPVHQYFLHRLSSSLSFFFSSSLSSSLSPRAHSVGDAGLACSQVWFLAAGMGMCLLAMLGGTRGGVGEEEGGRVELSTYVIPNRWQWTVNSEFAARCPGLTLLSGMTLHSRRCREC